MNSLFFSLACYLKWSMKIKVVRIIRLSSSLTLSDADEESKWSQFSFHLTITLRVGITVSILDEGTESQAWPPAQGRSSGEQWCWHSIPAHSVCGGHALNHPLPGPASCASP